MISMVCTSFFKDTEYRALAEGEVLHLDDGELPWKLSSVIPYHFLKDEFSDLFVSCRANDTLVKSVLGPNIFRVETLLRQLNLSWERAKALKIVSSFAEMQIANVRSMYKSI